MVPEQQVEVDALPQEALPVIDVDSDDERPLVFMHIHGMPITDAQPRDEVPQWLQGTTAEGLVDELDLLWGHRDAWAWHADGAGKR